MLLSVLAAGVAGGLVAGGVFFLGGFEWRPAQPASQHAEGAPPLVAHEAAAMVDSIAPTQVPNLPSQMQTTIMVRSAMLALDHAMRTGNFTVLRDLGSTRFREANSPTQLAWTFAKQAEAVNLLPAAVLEPKLSSAPTINEKGLLVIEGVFDIGQPGAFKFGLAYEAVDQSWRLFGISVGPVNSPPEHPL